MLDTMTPAPGGPNKWAVLGVVTFGAFITNADATIVVVALPSILTGLHTNIVTVLWTMAGFMLASTVLLLPVGRLSDLMGRRSLFLIGFMVFAAGSALCGLATTGAALVGFRLIQGTGAAAVMTLGVPIVSEVFPPEELGRALGINSVAWVMGSLIGPVAGGFLVSAAGWQSVFFVTVPFALAASAIGFRILPRLPRPERRSAMDWAGLAAFSVALTTLLVLLSEGLSWGWLSGRAIASWGVIAASLVAFLIVEQRVSAPLFDLSLFRDRQFTSAQGVVGLASLGFFATTFLLTFYLQGGLGLSPELTGVLLIPMSAPQFFSSPLGGWLSDRIGPRWPVLGGLLALGAGALWLSGLPPELDAVAIILPLGLMAIGNGFYWPPLTSFVMQSVPSARRGSASGLYYTFRNIGFSLSLTMALVFAESSLPPAVALRLFVGAHAHLTGLMAGGLVHAVDVAFRWFAGAFVLAVLCALGIRAGRGRQIRRIEEAGGEIGA